MHPLFALFMALCSCPHERDCGFRSVGSVLGFVIADRTDSALERLLVEELPSGWRDTTPVCTDFWQAYGRLLPADLHEACSKGSGKTSKVEALNTLWRQRQSGLVRKSCGVSWRMIDDLAERFLFLALWHNRRYDDELDDVVDNARDDVPAG